MEIIGYILAIMIGLSLGLVGSGGSIMTVPLLVYFFGIPAAQATSYSMFIVGTASALGALLQYRKGHVNTHIISLFGLTSVLTVFIVRKWILHRIPENLYDFGPFALTKSMVLMLLFAILLLGSAIFILKDMHGKQVTGLGHQAQAFNIGKLVGFGVGIGLITGFLGAGGGFLIVPVLIFLFRLEIKTAAGTSLGIIAVNTLLGLTGDIGHVQYDWHLLLAILGITLLGLFIGMRLSNQIQERDLTKGFGWFLLVMTLFVLFQEIRGLIA